MSSPSEDSPRVTASPAPWDWRAGMPTLTCAAGASLGERSPLTAAAFASLSSRLHKQGRAALVLWTAPTVLPKRCRSLALQAARVGAEMETAPSLKSTWPSSGQPAFLPAVPTGGWQRQDKSPLPVLSGIGLLSSPWQLQHLPSTSLKSVSLLPRDQLTFPLHPPCIHNCSAFLNNKLQYLITP